METGNIYKMPITQECIRAVYLGLAMSDEDRQKAVDAVARYFWRASKRHGDLSLDFGLAGPAK
jgi:hypothetical protein